MVMVKTIVRNKRLKKFKAFPLNTDEELYKEEKINPQKPIKSKTPDFCPEKLRENVGKSKNLWKALKSLGLTSKITPVSKISLKDEEKYDDAKANNTCFKNFYANFILNLVHQLLYAPNKFNLDSLWAYYKRFLNTENQKFTFSSISKDEVLKLLEDTKPISLSERFLKDGTDALALPMPQLCNLSMKRSKFPLDSEIENHYTRKGQKQIQETIYPLHFCDLC